MINDIKIQKIIDKGSFSLVYKCKIKNKNFALKYIKNSKSSVNNLMELFILKNLNCNYLMNSEFITIDLSNNIYIIQNIAKCNLNTYIKNSKNFNTENVKKILFDVSSAILFLHNLNICHCDIKPSNILIFYNFKNKIEAKLTDFGLSRILFNFDKNINIKNLYTKNYRPIDNFLSLKSDIWALGCVFYESTQNKKLFNSIFTPNNFLNSIFDNCNHDISILLSNMLNNNIETRYSIYDVLKHDYFKNLHNNKPFIPTIEDLNVFENCLFFNKYINTNTKIIDSISLKLKNSLFNFNEIDNSILELTNDENIIKFSFNIYYHCSNKNTNFDIIKFIPNFKTCIIVAFKIIKNFIPFKLNFYDINSELELIKILNYNFF
jgi:serine/threonine protein kinase